MSKFLIAGFSFMAVLLLAFSVIGYFGNVPGFEGTPVEFGGIDWYPVTEWEGEMCSKWGGTDRPTVRVDESLIANGALLSFTLQGRAREHKSNDGQKFFIYEVGYYVEPIRDEVTFSVELFNDQTGEVKNVVSASRSLPGGVSDYLVLNLPEIYTHARMRVSGVGKPLEVKLT